MTCMATVPVPKRGEIWLVNFEPAVGGEIRKIRPALVINLDDIGRLPLRMVVPITDWTPRFAAYPWFVRLPHHGAAGLLKPSGADAFQTKSLSIERFVRRLGILDEETVGNVAEAIALAVGAD